jgi:hypothetical protein
MLTMKLMKHITSSAYSITWFHPWPKDLCRMDLYRMDFKLDLCRVGTDSRNAFAW